MGVSCALASAFHGNTRPRENEFVESRLQVVNVYVERVSVDRDASPCGAGAERGRADLLEAPPPRNYYVDLYYIKLYAIIYCYQYYY